MTNSQQIIQAWTTLQELMKPFWQNKSLIREALELYLHQASSFTTEHSHPPLLNRRSIEQEKERLTKELENLTHQQEQITNEEHRAEIETEEEAINQQINQLATALNDNTVIDNFNRQKVKNERIVRECRELLGKLKGEI